MKSLMNGCPPGARKIKNVLMILSLIVPFPTVAWESPPPPPLPRLLDSKGKHDPFVINYKSYYPGQIKLGSDRLKNLVEEIQWHLRKRSKKTIKNISIIGYSDKIKIVHHQKIWDDLPERVRPSSPFLINNKIIAEGRAIYILDHLKNVLGYRLPTDIITVDKKAELPIGPKNRGIELRLNLVDNYGIDNE